MIFLRLSVISIGLILAWQALVYITGAPPYILPGPLPVAMALVAKWGTLWIHAWITIVEIVTGLVIGSMLGAASALIMMASRSLKRWLLPVLVMSQAVPVFALAPLLVLWLGYGMGSKITMAVLIIFFPVTAAFYDGLRRTEPEWLELGRVMNASPFAILYHIRIPAALPAFCLRATCGNGRGSDRSNCWRMGRLQRRPRFLYASCKCPNANGLDVCSAGPACYRRLDPLFFSGLDDE